MRQSQISFTHPVMQVEVFAEFTRSMPFIFGMIIPFIQIIQYDWAFRCSILFDRAMKFRIFSSDTLGHISV